MDHETTSAPQPAPLPSFAALRRASRSRIDAGIDMGIAALGRGLVTVFLVWPERRRQRLDLLELDDDRLRDLGIGRCEAEREGRKPFWR